MDISNKSLAFLLVASMILSLGGVFYSTNLIENVTPTGYAQYDTGTANLTINSDITITFTTLNVNFGSGFTNDTDGGPTIEYCYIDTNGKNPENYAAGGNCSGFNSGVSPFIIQNDGNLDVKLNITINESATDFFGAAATAPELEWFVENNEATSCTTPSPATFTSVVTTGINACGDNGFQSENTKDTIKLHIKVGIPQDAAPGTRQALITATGSTV